MTRLLEYSEKPGREISKGSLDESMLSSSTKKVNHVFFFHN